MSMETKKLNRKWVIGGIAYAILLFLILSVANIDKLNSWLGTLWLILRPVVFGLSLAYLLNPFFSFYERKLFCRLNPPTFRRFLSLLLAYLTLVLIIVFLFWMILPQLIDSIFMLVKNHESYIDTLAHGINNILSPINRFLEAFTSKSNTIEYVNAEDLIAGVSDSFIGFTEKLQNTEGSPIGLTQITGALSSAFSVLADTVFAIFISLYFLVSKEKRYAQIMRMRNAIFSDKVNGRISRVISTFDKSFGGFVKGKILDSVIIGILAYIAFAIFRIPFASLITVFIAITNIIPVVGPFIGAIPTGFIILLAEPQKFLPFLIIVIILQQLDGNVIGPKILGDNTGVSSLCVVIAISTMGALWGFTGMILGVPLFASVLKLGEHYTEKALQKKGLPSEIESYYASDALVDPAKDSHLTTDRMVKRLEKNILRIREELQTKKEAELSFKDRFCLRIYRLSRKYHILTDMEDETIIQFGAEQHKNRIFKETEERFSHLEEETTEASTDSNA